MKMGELCRPAYINPIRRRGGPHLEPLLAPATAPIGGTVGSRAQPGRWESAGAKIDLCRDYYTEFALTAQKFVTVSAAGQIARANSNS